MAKKNTKDRLPNCFYKTNNGKVIQNITCQQIIKKQLEDEIIKSFYMNRPSISQVYPLTSTFESNYDPLLGIRTAAVLGSFLLMLVLHTYVKGKMAPKKSELRISTAREVVMKSCRDNNVVMHTFPDNSGYYNCGDLPNGSDVHDNDLQYEGNGFWRNDRTAILDHTSIMATAQWIHSQPLIGDEANSDQVLKIGSLYGSACNVNDTNGQLDHNIRSYFDCCSGEDLSHSKLSRVSPTRFNKLRLFCANIDIRNGPVKTNHSNDHITQQFYDPNAFKQVNDTCPLNSVSSDQNEINSDSTIVCDGLTKVHGNHRSVKSSPVYEPTSKSTTVIMMPTRSRRYSCQDTPIESPTFSNIPRYYDTPTNSTSSALIGHRLGSYLQSPTSSPPSFNAMEPIRTRSKKKSSSLRIELSPNRPIRCNEAYEYPIKCIQR